jgi:hypothetical protein
MKNAQENDAHDVGRWLGSGHVIAGLIAVGLTLLR